MLRLRLAPHALAARAAAARGFSAASFASLGVPPVWLPRLAALGATEPTPAQAAALPVLFAGRGAVLRAETGSGKTLAYLLPVLEAMRARVAAQPDAAAQLLPVALVVVPTEELAAQVARVAAALYPEQANMVRVAHGLLGVTRRMNAGLVVATPRAAAEAVHAVHKSALRFVVLDEADALLSGATLPLLRSGLLAPLKALPPDARPAHFFCAATLSSRGKLSVVSFLDRFYAPDECARLETAGSHRIAERVRQAFWQVDAAVPLTATERARKAYRAAAGARRREERAAARAAGDDDAAGGDGAAAAALAEDGAAEGAGEGTGEGEDAEEPVAFDGGSEEEADDSSSGSSSGGGGGDDVRDAMAGRVTEDALLASLADEKRYADKVAALTRAAVIEALLLPARRAGLLGGGGSGGGNGDGGDDSAAAAAAAAAPRAPPARPSNTLGELREGRAASAKTVRAAERAARAAAVPAIPAAAAPGAPAPEGGIELRAGAAAGGAAPGAPPAWLQPFSPPGGATRGKLSAEEAALVPPTLVFVNSVRSADSLRRALAAALPSVRVSMLHADVPESARVARLADFARGAVRVLVATNLAARGLDTTHVAHVIQAEFAGDVVAHLHRVGRTARAGRAGAATALLVRANLPLAAAAVAAQDAGVPLDAAFSQRRSFARKAKRVDMAAAAPAGAEGA